MKDCCKLTVFAMLLVMALPAVGTAAVGFVNLDKIFTESAVGKTAIDDLERLYGINQRKIEGSRIRLTELKKLIDIDAYSKKNKSEKEDEYIKEIKTHDVLIQRLEMQIDFQMAVLYDFIKRKVKIELNTVAPAHSVEMVFFKEDGIGYISPSVDLTQEVLKRLDKGGRP